MVSGSFVVSVGFDVSDDFGSINTTSRKNSRFSRSYLFEVLIFFCLIIS